MASVLTSAAPFTVLIIAAISFALVAKTFKSLPYNLIATSSRTPVRSSLNRSSTGCVKIKLAPTITFNFSCIFSTNSAFVTAEVHLFVSFSKMIKQSAISIGIGSVGISATPILETIVITSGKLALIIFSTSFETFMDSDKELPGFIIICIAISPSSNFGINSPPIFENTKPALTNKIKAMAITVFLNFRAL